MFLRTLPKQLPPKLLDMVKLLPTTTHTESWDTDTPLYYAKTVPKVEVAPQDVHIVIQFHAWDSPVLHHR